MNLKKKKNAKKQFQSDKTKKKGGGGVKIFLLWKVQKITINLIFIEQQWAGFNYYGGFLSNNCFTRIWFCQVHPLFLLPLTQNTPFLPFHCSFSHFFSALIL